MKEAHSCGTSVWVTFPYDASLRDGQPEVAAKLFAAEKLLEVIRPRMRAKKLKLKVTRRGSFPQNWTNSRAPSASLMPPRLLPLPFIWKNASAPLPMETRIENERRRQRAESVRDSSARHPERIPCFEEAMTIDVSAKGMRFRSHREYALGDRLKIAFADPPFCPWHGTGEFLSDVVRVAPVPGSAAVDVSVCRVE